MPDSTGLQRAVFVYKSASSHIVDRALGWLMFIHSLVEQNLGYECEHECFFLIDGVIGLRGVPDFQIFNS